jgi:uncharacterized membrane protein
MSAYRLILLLIPVLLIAAAVVLFLRTQRLRTQSGPSADYQIFGPGARDDDRYWLAGGFFYNNPNDPALFVINRWGIGITVNLAHRLGRWVAVGILLALALIPILLTLFVPGLGSSGYGCHPSGCSNPFPPLP